MYYHIIKFHCQRFFKNNYKMSEDAGMVIWLLQYLIVYFRIQIVKIYLVESTVMRFNHGAEYRLVSLVYGGYTVVAAQYQGVSSKAIKHCAKC